MWLTLPCRMCDRRVRVPIYLRKLRPRDVNNSTHWANALWAFGHQVRRGLVARVCSRCERGARGRQIKGNDRALRALGLRLNLDEVETDVPDELLAEFDDETEENSEAYKKGLDVVLKDARAHGVDARKVGTGVADEEYTAAGDEGLSKLYAPADEGEFDEPLVDPQGRVDDSAIRLSDRDWEKIDKELVRLRKRREKEEKKRR